MAPSRPDPTPELRAELAELRAKAQAIYRAALEAGPDPADDPLGALAWHMGLRSDSAFPFNEDTRQRINTARHARLTWQEIIVALGDADESPAHQARVRSRQAWRNRRHAEMTAGVPADEDDGDDESRTGGVPLH